MSSRRRQQTTARELAEEIDIDREGVGTVDRIGGLDVFLRGPGPSQFGRNVRRDFASEADFVEPGDVNPRIDAQDISAEPRVARDRRDDVGRRARQHFAEEDEFAEPSDFTTDVGAFGVREARLSDIGARRRAGRQFASETRLESVGPDDVRATDGGFALGEAPQRQLAAFEFADATPVDTFDPESDIVPTEGGFGLTSGAQREVAARQFETDFELFGRRELDPTTDIRAVGGGFGLGEDPARELAAADIEAQLGQPVDPTDIDLEPVNGGFEAIFEGGGR